MQKQGEKTAGTFSERIDNATSKDPGNANLIAWNIGYQYAYNSQQSAFFLSRN